MRKFVNVEEQLKIEKLYTLFSAVKSENYEFNGEFHDFWECLFVIKGELLVTADDKVYNLSSGDIIFHKPMEFHKYKVTSDYPAKVLIFSFSAKGESIDFFRDKVFKLNPYQSNIINDFIVYIKNNSKTFKENDSYDYLFKNSSPLYIQSIICHIYLLMISLMENCTFVPASVSKESIIYSEIINYMNDNLHNNLSIEQFAKHANISISGLKRLFVKHAGINVHKYFLLLRLSSATKLINDGYSIGEVADTLGFSSQEYFSKAYKREFGISPSKIITSYNIANEYK